MIDEEKINAALSFAAEKHKGQYRIGGAPYITHPETVAEMVRSAGGSTEEIITALFHDLLEDTDTSEREIESIGGGEVLTAVRLLTKKAGLAMEDYVSAIRANPIAFRVKGFDRLHNLMTADERDNAFIERYIAETEKYYMDFNPGIAAEVERLKALLSERTEGRGKNEKT